MHSYLYLQEMVHSVEAVRMKFVRAIYSLSDPSDHQRQMRLILKRKGINILN
jgi:hypothetical protein